MANEQALELFVQVACDVKRRKPVVIVVDGLDEASRTSLEDAVTILAGLSRSSAGVGRMTRLRSHSSLPFSPTTTI